MYTFTSGSAAGNRRWSTCFMKHLIVSVEDNFSHRYQYNQLEWSVNSRLLKRSASQCFLLHYNEYHRDSDTNLCSLSNMSWSCGETLMSESLGYTVFSLINKQPVINYSFFLYPRSKCCVHIFGLFFKIMIWENFVLLTESPWSSQSTQTQQVCLGSKNCFKK